MVWVEITRDGFERLEEIPIDIHHPIESLEDEDDIWFTHTKKHKDLIIIYRMIVSKANGRLRYYLRLL